MKMVNLNLHLNHQNPQILLPLDQLLAFAIDLGIYRWCFLTAPKPTMLSELVSIRLSLVVVLY
jgi:hypothetical protein